MAERPLHAIQAAEEWLPLTQNWLGTQVRSLEPAVRSTVVCWRAVDDGSAEQARFVTRGHRLRTIVDKVRSRLGWEPADDDIARFLGPDIDLVHAHFGNHAWRVSRAVSRQGTPLIASFYGLDVTYLPTRDRRWRDRYRALFERAMVVLVLGPWMTDRLVELGCPREKLRIHHLGIAVDEIPFHERQPSAGPLRVLVASAFREKKGIPDAIRAVAMLSGEAEVSLTIVGDGPDARARHERIRIQEAIREAGLGDRIRVLPKMPRAALLALAREHDVLLAPSRTAADGDAEGTPMILADMAAVGIPIVTTHHADIPEIIPPGIAGLVVAEGDVGALAAALAEVRREPASAAVRARAARARVEDRFSSERQGLGLVDIYREVVRPSPGPGAGMGGTGTFG